jgi:hypothetical protein
MKALLIFILSMTLYSPTGTKVFICDSPSSVAYHSTKYCRGLQKCTHEVLEVYETEAQNKDLRPCKICY